VTEVKKAGVITSGGDAPGMNAALRAIARTAAWHGVKIVAFEGGYDGIINGIGQELSPRHVSNIIQRGGTVIHTGRSDAFLRVSGRRKAAATLRRTGVDGLILIGGDGTFRGALKLAKIWDGTIIGVPGTIDNDLWGTDSTIGFDTAVNTALESIDRIRDTAEAHRRMFIIEVMGREAGFIALAVGIGGGAEEIIIPEKPADLQEMARQILADRAKGKRSLILVAAEGGKAGGAVQIARQLKEMTGIESRVTVLGHVQRGGSPTAADRLLATKLGAFAVESLLAGKSMVMVGEQGGRLTLVPLEDAANKKKSVDEYLLKLVRILAS
jgi:6-phosphofructokinase 1